MPEGIQEVRECRVTQSPTEDVHIEGRGAGAEHEVGDRIEPGQVGFYRDTDVVHPALDPDPEGRSDRVVRGTRAEELLLLDLRPVGHDQPAALCHQFTVLYYWFLLPRESSPL